MVIFLVFIGGVESMTMFALVPCKEQFDIIIVSVVKLKKIPVVPSTAASMRA
eukprot:CAMPEP_0181139098 /NCGR_PEP_ID=MMETSP1071-20121207/34605_1 /TAXON_ID=35127 /ORGANISM="Thalassiosira sp., Strain NH16" /LENGTH=51 /DNA_ID=CAMNT_0023225991 /DNA_START=847 /DNA_END=998 /DNA_ORIENTATION=-